MTRIGPRTAIALSVGVLLLTSTTSGCSAADDAGRAGMRILEQRAAQQAARHATSEVEALSRAKTIIKPYGGYASDETRLRRFLKDACEGRDVVEKGGSMALGQWVKGQWPSEVEYGSAVSNLAVDLANQGASRDAAVQAAVEMICG